MDHVACAVLTVLVADVMLGVVCPEVFDVCINSHVARGRDTSDTANRLDKVTA